MAKHIQKSGRRRMKQSPRSPKSGISKHLRARRRARWGEIWWRIAPWTCASCLPQHLQLFHSLGPCSFPLLLKFPLGTSLLSLKTLFFLAPPLCSFHPAGLLSFCLYYPWPFLTFPLPHGALAVPLICYFSLQCWILGWRQVGCREGAPHRAGRYFVVLRPAITRS